MTPIREGYAPRPDRPTRRTGRGACWGEPEPGLGLCSIDLDAPGRNSMKTWCLGVAWENFPVTTRMSRRKVINCPHATIE